MFLIRSRTDERQSPELETKRPCLYTEFGLVKLCPLSRLCHLPLFCRLVRDLAGPRRQAEERPRTLRSRQRACWLTRFI